MVVATETKSAYSIQAGSTHPTGMLSKNRIINISFTLFSLFSILRKGQFVCNLFQTLGVAHSILKTSWISRVNYEYNTNLTKDFSLQCPTLKNSDE